MIDIKIHLIHGSIPKNRRATPTERLLGFLGGHALLEMNGYVYSFSYNLKKVRYFPNDAYPNGKVKIEDIDFWINKTNWEKRTTFTINSTQTEVKFLEKLFKTYKESCPFDYSLFGERCCSVHCKMLQKINIVKSNFWVNAASNFPFIYIPLFKHFLLSPAKEKTVNAGCETRIWF